MESPIYRVVGPPPPSGTNRAGQLRWVRRFYTRLGLPILIAVAVVTRVVGIPGWAIAICVVVEVGGLGVISLQITRAERTDS